MTTIIAKLKETLPRTTERVPVHTAVSVNRRIREKMERQVRYYADHPEKIEKRLQELDREWDVERALEANASSLALLGLGLGLKDRRFLVIPGVVTGFLLMHALQGWCPPVPLLRRLGIRTQAEIQAERNSLKSLKDAFADLGQRLESISSKTEEDVKKTSRHQPVKKVMEAIAGASPLRARIARDVTP
jgi:hypothetical protein